MPLLRNIAVESFRCFSYRQEAHLAPLTFLVGANSTGKTSFLALLRGIWRTVLMGKLPDFTSTPYNLGAFQDIISNTSSTVDPNKSFGVELSFLPTQADNSEVKCTVQFSEINGLPFPYSRKFSYKSVWIELFITDINSHTIRCHTPLAQWEFELNTPFAYQGRLDLVPIHHLMIELKYNSFGLMETSTPVNKSGIDLNDLTELSEILLRMHSTGAEPFASAPVRSSPRRTYDLNPSSADPEGVHIPTSLASMKLHDQAAWNKMKRSLESFGQKLGLFDTINVNLLKSGTAGPFQIEIKQHGVDGRSSSRNLIDVGYGVSQVLPLLTELLRDSVADMCLIQQPEVHLHPSAQAELGTLFTEVCARNRQLIIETHSDYLINRVRLDIRDRECKINENDVSILFFESVGNSVEIHSIRIDKMGNILGAPPSYRRFFTDETDREVQF